MRILHLSQWFDPEPVFKALFLAKAFHERGHHVEVLTGLPNYPTGRLYPGYKLKPFQREVMDGVPILRVPLYPSHDTSAIGRIANYSSFALSAAAIGPMLARKADVAYVFASPVTVGLPAIALRALRGIPFVFDIQDLWPDTVAHSGMMSHPAALALINPMCNISYRFASRIVVPAPGLKSLLVERGVPAGKIEVLYNWCDDTAIKPVAPDPELAQKSGLAGRFNVVFAGNMGTMQALHLVLRAAQISALRTPAAQYVLIGGGIEVESLQKAASEMGLTNVRFIPPQPVSAIGSFLALADAVLVHLKDIPLYRRLIPTKTQAYMVAGRPILMAVAGDAADLIEKSGAGVTCAPEDPEALAAAVEKLSAMSREDREALGARGKAFYWREMSSAIGVQRLERILETVAGERSK